MKTFVKSLCLLSVVGYSTTLLALDPVTPKSQRNRGHLTVVTPLPDSDVCSLTGKVERSFKCGDVTQVPPGDYELKVKLQSYEWASPITVQPTELTRVTVTGYGNLQVNVNKVLSKDMVEIVGEDKQVVKSFVPNQVQTLPEGVYTVKVKLEKAKEVSQENIRVVTNTTREINVSR